MKLLLSSGLSSFSNSCFSRTKESFEKLWRSQQNTQISTEILRESLWFRMVKQCKIVRFTTRYSQKTIKTFLRKPISESSNADFILLRNFFDFNDAVHISLFGGLSRLHKLFQVWMYKCTRITLTHHHGCFKFLKMYPKDRWTWICFFSREKLMPKEPRPLGKFDWLIDKSSSDSEGEDIKRENRNRKIVNSVLDRRWI